MRKKLTAFLALTVLLSFAAMAGAGDITVIKSEGVALRADNIAEVKRKAIDQALKNAVSTSLDRLVEGEGVTGFDKTPTGKISAPLF